ncbi:MAG: hypothetical protein JW981_02045 [Anaerolineae bacterium]|nr:hypothetical protein [Anaerolineae bacterium]
MVELLTIKTTNKTTLKSLLTAAIEREKQRLKQSITHTQDRLAQFEQEYHMTSEEFQQRLYNLEIDETVDFTDWRMEIETLHLLQNQYKTLKEATVD